MFNQLAAEMKRMITTFVELDEETSARLDTLVFNVAEEVLARKGEEKAEVPEISLQLQDEGGLRISVAIPAEQKSSPTNVGFVAPRGKWRWKGTECW
jgi:hypothetical protein